MNRHGSLFRCLGLLLAAAGALLAGCAAAPNKDDPLEPWNRAMYEVHQVVDGGVVKPIAQAYVAVTPEPIRTGVSNFFGNIDDLFTGINNVLEGRGDQAGDDFGRVLLNSTFGMGGILDLASMMGITKDKKDFGITFGKWGAPPGPYLFVPLFGPTTVRDGTGTLVRLFIGPVGYIPNVALRNSIYGVGYVDTRAQALSAESVLDTAAIDRYRFLRNAYLKARRYQVYDGKPPPEEDEDDTSAVPAAPAAPGTPAPTK
jgi:phospholipid-binding lipoprotein MlaA